MSFPEDFRRLQKLINEADELTLALGWSDADNEELRFYDKQSDTVVAKVEAVGGYIAIDVPASQRSES